MIPGKCRQGRAGGGAYIWAWIAFIWRYVSFAFCAALGKPVLLAGFGTYGGWAWIFGSLLLDQKCRPLVTPRLYLSIARPTAMLPPKAAHWGQNDLATPSFARYNR